MKTPQNPKDLLMEKGAVQDEADTKAQSSRSKTTTTQVIEVELNGNNGYQMYASPHNAELQAGDTIKFIAKNSDFVILIDNRDGFFTTSQQFIHETIYAGSDLTFDTDPNLGNHRDKYYSAYCVNNDDYADKPGSSPPKIIVY